MHRHTCLFELISGCNCCWPDVIIVLGW
jgi:hypothetical protein